MKTFGKNRQILIYDHFCSTVHYITLHPTVLLKFPSACLNQIIVSAGIFTCTSPAISRNLTTGNPRTHAAEALM